MSYILFEESDQCKFRWILFISILFVFSCGIGAIITWFGLDISPSDMTLYDYLLSIWIGLLITIFIVIIVTVIKSVVSRVTRRNLEITTSV